VDGKRAFWIVAALCFAATTAITIAWCGSMSMREMPMPCGWTMSMAWMRMPGQTWFSAAAAFLGMWLVMMVAMMLPSLAPALWRSREVIGERGAHRIALVVAGYFSVWTLFGMCVFPVGVALTTIAMQRPSFARAVPLATGVVVLLAGALQFTSWKAHHLACCRDLPLRGRANATGALQHGLRLGIHCSECTAGLTAILLVLGVMDLRVMAAITLAITAERLAAEGTRVTHAIGVIAIAAGVFFIARAM
jgi:predicted metal-binding membrane protein